MNQIEYGSFPFDDVPIDASDIQIFPIISNDLISAVKLVKAGHTIILDRPEAVVINKISQNIVMQAQFDSSTSTWNDYPSGQVQYDLTNAQKDQFYSLGTTATQSNGIVVHFDNNIYCLRTKQEIVEYYHAAAGWSVKRLGL